MARAILPLRKFDPFQMPGELVRRLAVGREAELADLLAFVDDNLAAAGPPQHVCLIAPRGSGKTFLLRLLGLTLAERAAAGEPIHFLHLPEEMPHVGSPMAFLREVLRHLLGAGPGANAPRKRDTGPDWPALAAELDQALAARFAGQPGLLVLCVENIKDVLRTAFRDEVARRELRAWLERPRGRVMLIAASSAGPFDRDSEKALFAIVRNIDLRPWTIDETIAFLNRVVVARDGHALAPRDERVARAIAVFTGGSPRLATAMAEVLGAEDAMSAAQTLDALIDNLQEYYLNRLRDLTDEENRCVANLLVEGENVSQTEVARRLNVEQSAIAQAFRKLEHADAFLIGERLHGEKEKLYRVADRVFVHFYNVRILYHGGERSVLAPILDFLVSAFSETQRAEQAERLMALGHHRDADVLLGTLTRLTPAVLEYKWWSGNREFLQLCADLLAERRPDAAPLVAAIRELVRDPASQPVVPAATAMLDIAPLLPALDHLAKGRVQPARRGAEDFQRRAADGWLQALAWLLKFRAAYLVDDMLELEHCVKTAAEISSKQDDSALLAMSNLGLRYVLVVKGEVQTARQKVEQSLPLDFPLGWIWLRAAAHRQLAKFAFVGNEMIEAEQLARRALALARESRRQGTIARCMLSLSDIALNLQRYQEARELAETAAAISLDAGELDDHISSIYVLTDALRASGQSEAAIEQSERCATLMAARGGPYLRAGAAALFAWDLTAPQATRKQERDQLAVTQADVALAGLDDIPLFAHWRCVALEAKLAVATRSGDASARLAAARPCATAARLADRKAIVAWARAESVGAWFRRQAYDETIAEAVATLRELIAFPAEAESNLGFVASKLGDALRHTGRPGDLRRIVADIAAEAGQEQDGARKTALRDTFLPAAVAAGDYQFGVELIEAARPGSTEPPQRANLALACIAGANAWRRLSPVLDDRSWTAAAAQIAGWDVAEAILKVETAQGRAVAYTVFRGAWDHLRDEAVAKGPQRRVLRDILTYHRLSSLSAGLLGDIAATLEAEASGRFTAELRLLRQLAGFQAAGGGPAALARLDPDVAAALRALEPATPPPTTEPPARKRHNAPATNRKPRRRKTQG